LTKEWTKDELAALVAGEYKDAVLAAAARMLAALMAAQAAAAELERLMSDGTYAKDALLMGIDFNKVVAQLEADTAEDNVERFVECFADAQNVWDKVSERFGWDKMYNATLNDDEPGWLMQNLAEGIEVRKTALAELAAG
jgi:hypothetical protein